MKNAIRLASAAAVLLGAPLVGVAEGPSYAAKVWSNDGYIWTLNHMTDSGVAGEWHYWAPGEEGTLHWDDVDWIVFEENLHPNRYGPWNREMPRGRRATVRFNSGETRELYVQVELLYGKDDWGVRKVYGDDVTKVDFLETRMPMVRRCPNGHVWPQEGYRFCPYDGLPVTEYEQY